LDENEVVGKPYVGKKKGPKGIDLSPTDAEKANDPCLTDAPNREEILKRKLFGVYSAAQWRESAGSKISNW